MDPSKVDWLDTTIGTIGGAFASVVALFGWFGRKIGVVHARIDRLETMAKECQIFHSAQSAHHHDNLRRLEGIEDSVVKLCDKQDDHLELILGRLTTKR